MKLIFTALIIISTLPLVSFAEKPAIGSRTVFVQDNLLKDGEMALRDGELETAIELFLAGLPHASTQRNEAAALNNLCAAYGTLGQFKTALDYCDRSLTLRPNNWRAYTNRARSLVGIGELGAAIEAANKGLEIAPNAAPLKEILSLAQSMNVEPHVIIDNFNSGSEN